MNQQLQTSPLSRHHTQSSKGSSIQKKFRRTHQLDRVLCVRTQIFSVRLVLETEERKWRLALRVQFNLGWGVFQQEVMPNSDRNSNLEVNILGGSRGVC